MIFPFWTELFPFWNELLPFWTELLPFWTGKGIDTAEEVGMNSSAMFFHGLLHIDTH